MPGQHALVAQLGLGRETLQEALRILEKEGLLVAQGAGRRRQISLARASKTRSLRIAILRYEAADGNLNYLLDLDLQHRIRLAGHHLVQVESNLLELRMDVNRLSQLVRKTEADAWIVISATAEILQWFAAQKVPAFGLFGRVMESPLAGTKIDKIKPLEKTMERLLTLGHRRIVMIIRKEHIVPAPSPLAGRFIEILKEHSIGPGPFNLPIWENNTLSFSKCLESLFAFTPPTAVIAEEPAHFMATLQFLNQKSLTVPQDVSMVCMDKDPHFAWCHPPVSHFDYDRNQLVRRILRWIHNIQRGKNDTGQKLFPAELVEGETIGPVKKK